MSFTNNSQQSILIIGASGRTGLACIHQLSKHSGKPAIHAFCRDSRKLAPDDKALCTSLVEGNACNASDLEHALQESRATDVIVSVGGGDSVAKSDVREASAKALVSVLRKPAFRSVRVLIVSSTGAGGSKIVVGFGMGALISFHLRHILKDHSRQEEAVLPVMDRTIIVRATALTDNEATGKLVEFGDTEKSPSLKTDRADLAAWVAQELCANQHKSFGNRVFNVTGVKQ